MGDADCLQSGNPSARLPAFVSHKKKNHFRSYCGDSGIQYNMLRVPIGGTDFSTHGYAYNELPENDVTLSNFTLAYEDYEYKIPMIKACMKAASAPIHIVSATWSPPIWMKTNDAYSGHSKLRKEYRQTYADYHYKFLEHYAAEGIPVWGVSISNEPLHASVNYIPAKINNMGWTLDEMSEYVMENLGPTLRGNNSNFKHVKIIAGDDLRFTITLFWNTNLGNDVIGWLDWNMCLNTEGKPSYIGSSVDSPILVNAEEGEFYKQPMFYAIGHFSKFVPRGSRRIRVNVDCGDKEAELIINANSITTVEMLNKNDMESNEED
ncbi:hypothetical protein HF086_005215 [Spodoptera exigua]|uniref:Glucosylceramidase n=1 Tax=Spodoptera exigua TaxID=7107 RepID=A0A922MZE6_SPOEX|nr:hypothetical protein HF086_005215 [Spodoptera exigua]